MKGNSLKKSQTIVILILLVVSVFLLCLYFYLLRGIETSNGEIPTDNILSVVLGLFTSTSSSLLVLFLAIKNVQAEEVRLMRDTFDEVIKENNNEFPQCIYEGSKEPNKKFNIDINDDFSRSDTFFFEGRSGKYIPIRLLKHVSEMTFKSSLVAIVNNPFNKELTRVMDSHQNGINKDVSMLTYLNNFYTMIFGFLKCYSLVNEIEIILANHLIMNRVELCNNNLYLQAFLEQDLRRNQFPTTFKYKSQSFVYECVRGNSMKKRYIYLPGSERVFPSDFAIVYLRHSSDNGESIQGIRIILKSKVSSDCEILKFMQEIFSAFHVDEIQKQEILSLFKKFMKEV